MRRPPNLMKGIAGPVRPPPPPPADPGLPTNYLDLYGLSKPPFDGPREGNGFILFGSQKRAFELLIGHVVNGAGAVLLQGEEGVGKTEMLRAAANVGAESGVQIVRVGRPPTGRTNLSQLVAALAGPGTTEETTADDAIRQFLAPPRKALLVDDIDIMPGDCVRLLLTLLTSMPSDPGGPAIVFGSTAPIGVESERSDLAELVPLLRNTIRMLPLGPAEVQQYIERSLWIAGGTTRRLITQDALKTVIAQSGGVPGSVNRLMEAAFTAGFARGDTTITAKTIATTISAAPRRPRWEAMNPGDVAPRVFQIVAAVLFVSGVFLFLYRALDEPPPKPKPAPVALVKPPPASVDVSPRASPPPARQTATLPPELMAALMKRGEQSLSLGDIAAARLLFQRAADGGSAAAATALGKTYDPDYAAPGEKRDPARAVEWYRKAVAMGDARAAEMLKRLETN
jgi:type II secretory pathway predicted ATPase ExeA